MKTQTVSKVRFRCLEDINNWQRVAEKLRIQTMTFQKVNISNIPYPFTL